MTGINDRPIAVLDRTSVLSATPAANADSSRTMMLRQAAQPTTSYTVAPQRPVAEEAASESSPRPPLPRGWGSHEERRLMHWGMVGFLLLATYAVVFISIGALVWS